MRKTGGFLFGAFLVLFGTYMAGRLSLLGVVPDLPVIFVVYKALWAPRTDAFRFAVLVGLGLDAIGPGPIGLNAAVLGLAALSASHLGTCMNKDSTAVRAMLVFASCFAGRAAAFSELSACGAGPGPGAWMMEAVLASAFTSAIGIPILHVASRMASMRGMGIAGGLSADA